MNYSLCWCVTYSTSTSSSSGRHLLLLGFGSWFPSSLKWFSSSDRSGFLRHGALWDFEFSSSCSEVLFIRKHQPETHSNRKLRAWYLKLGPYFLILSLNYVFLQDSFLFLTFHSVSWCRSQRWCCRRIHPARYKLFSRDGPLSPVTHTQKHQDDQL